MTDAANSKNASVALTVSLIWLSLPPSPIYTLYILKIVILSSKSLPTATFPTCLAGEGSSVTESSIMSNDEASFDESIPVEHVQRTQQPLSTVEENFNVFCGCIYCYLHAFVPTKVKMPHWTPHSLFDQSRCSEDYDVFCSSVVCMYAC